MISIILYGRNDSYGYNLHKRAALSLNCMSEILTEPDDEVVFVDYNTPNDYPTFPEAIQDTLTERAKERLRILRVRPTTHANFSSRTHLLVLEPVARNIGVRRSNPNNRWILSTNTDMIFVPRDGTSLSKHVRDLARGFYHLPRFEIPETLWETFDRKDARGTIEALRYWGRAAHLNEIVLGFPVIRFDGPGDFQLIARDDLIHIHGFDESMLLGWHVDSNVAKRVHLLHGKTGDMLDHLFGYHCDHTRQVTPAHRADSVSNDWHHFFEDVAQPFWEEAGADNWGAPNDDVEEIRLTRTRNSVYLQALAAVIPREMASPTTADYIPESYNKVSYNAPHVLPFLGDAFVNAPQGTRIGWIGANPDMFRLFADFWKKMEFGAELMVAAEIAGLIRADSVGVRILSFDALAAQADGFVFDFAIAGDTLIPAEGDPSAEDKKKTIAVLKSLFLHFIRVERRRLACGDVPRRVVCVNAVHNDFEGLIGSVIGAARTPFSPRIRQGFVKAPDEKQSLWAKFLRRK